MDTSIDTLFLILTSQSPTPWRRDRDHDSPSHGGNNPDVDTLWVLPLPCAYG
jgi:hypothetical protein